MLGKHCHKLSSIPHDTLNMQKEEAEAARKLAEVAAVSLANPLLWLLLILFLAFKTMCRRKPKQPEEKSRCRMMCVIYVQAKSK